MNFYYNSIRNDLSINTLNQNDLIPVSTNVSLIVNKGTYKIVASVAQQLIKQNQEIRQVNRLSRQKPLKPRKLFGSHCKQCVQFFIDSNKSPLDRLEKAKKIYPQLAIEAKENRERRRRAWIKELHYML